MAKYIAMRYRNRIAIVAASVIYTWNAPMSSGCIAH
jgi:hypothetical protein